MAKNVNPRYTNAVYWTGGTIDSSTVTFDITARSTDCRINTLQVINTFSSAQTLKMHLNDTASTTLATINLNIPGNAGHSATSTYNAFGGMSLPIDTAGNYVLNLPAGYSMQFEQSAIQTTTTISLFCELGDFAED